MKNSKRWIALLLALLMCLSLCGCDELDDMRSTHAFWQEDGSILWNGNVYRRLGDEDTRMELDIVYDNLSINVTAKDVPVLLSGVFGDPFDVCADGTLLESYDWQVGYVMYCREDVYAETEAYLKNGFELAAYYYSYFDEDYNSYNYYLTESQTDAINEVLETVIPASDAEYEDEPIWDSLILHGCDESHRFSQSYLLDLWMTETGYFLVSEDGVYPVPETFHPIFNDIVKAYEESKGDWDRPPSVMVA